MKLSAAAFDRLKKKLPKGKYKYVYSYILSDGTKVHKAYISTYGWSKYFKTEREAAIEVDKYLLNKGKEPVNVLVKKL